MQDAYQQLLNAVQVKDTGDGQNLQRMQVSACTLGFAPWGLQLYPRVCTLHPAPCTLGPAPCTLQLYPRVCTLRPAPCIFASLLLVPTIWKVRYTCGFTTSTPSTLVLQAALVTLKDAYGSLNSAVGPAAGAAWLKQFIGVEQLLLATVGVSKR